MLSHQEMMFELQGPEVAQPWQYSSIFTKRIRTTSSAFRDNVSKTIKRARRQTPSNGPEIPPGLCSTCLEHVLDRSEDTIHDIHLVTSLSLTFDGSCPHQQFHVAQILATMEGLNRLEIIDARSTPRFYATLAERAHFQLEYFACGSPLFDTLLHFLSTQRRLLEFTYLPRSQEAQTVTQVRGQEMLQSVQTLSTTARLLLYPKLAVTSLLHLTYVGVAQSLREEVWAIEKIYRLGPQLRSLRFMWGAGRKGTFLDVTKFFSIAENTPLIEHLYLSDISRNVSGYPSACSIFSTYGEDRFQIFEQFIITGLRHGTWKKLQTLVWIPSLPHDQYLDEPEYPVSPVSSVFPLLSHSFEPSDATKVDYPTRSRRLSASSWTSSRSPRSSFRTPASSRRARSSSISHVGCVGLDFRNHRIGKELMTTFPSFRRLALWNWDRSGYDLLTRAADDLVWTHDVEMDEDERL